jgi:hypothetical protein
MEILPNRGGMYLLPFLSKGFFILLNPDFTLVKSRFRGGVEEWEKT